MKIIYLKNLKSLTELKSKYRTLSKKYHPDLNPNIDEEIFKQINAEHKYLLLNFESHKRRDLIPDIIKYSKIIKKKKYKPASLWYFYLEMLQQFKQEYDEFELYKIAEINGYSKGWVYYKIKELTHER